MKHVEKTLNKFEVRTQEVVESYKALKEKRDSLQAELDNAKRTVNIDLSAGDLLAGNYQKKNSKVAQLTEEIEAIDEFISNVENLRLQHRTNDLAIVCKADKELEIIGEELVKDYEKQSQELNKAKEDLDKRTDKFLSQLVGLIAEFDDLRAQQMQMNDIQEKVERRTNHKLNKLNLRFRNEIPFNNFKQLKQFLSSH